ncbi:MAG: hypothetical protein WDO13_11440 [Verrucomicrobiota bacterium]
MTWDQQDDKHWFGGRIPGKVHSIEFVTVAAGADGQPSYAYESYEGSPPQKSAGLDVVASQPRIDAITGLRAAVMP